MINSKLENLLILEKSKNRFRRTKLRDIKEIPNQDSDHIKSFSYLLSFDRFQMKMHYHLDKAKDQESFSLDISVFEGKSIYSFDNSNPDYAPTLREIYEDLQKKKKDSEEKEEKEKEKMHYRESKRLMRFL